MDRPVTLYLRDDWPVMPNGEEYDGLELLRLIRENNDPFRHAWNTRQLIAEIEKHLQAKVLNVVTVTRGSNNYGLHLELAGEPDVVVRLSRADVNMPGFDGFPLAKQVLSISFQAAIYRLSKDEPTIQSSELLYFRTPQQVDQLATRPPPDNLGRGCMIFRLAPSQGKQMDWRAASDVERCHVLKQAARIRANLFKYKVPQDFAAPWLRMALFDPVPNNLLHITETRKFAVSLFQSKIRATIGEIGDMIGWPEDDEVVGPRAFAAKHSLLRVIPYILPEEPDQAPLFYRHVLEHGDFGVHNLTITDQCEVTSIYDWETAYIVPALLADPEVAVIVDLTTDENGRPLVTRVPRDATEVAIAQGKKWCALYIEELFSQAPEFEKAIKAGKHARHLWSALKAWRGEDPEGYFGKLGDWAENLINQREEDLIRE